MEKMNTILRLSYNDLPFHLKTCMLSLSKYPEDQVIRKDVLVWSWIAEGFIAPAAGSTLQEVGEGYFNELINRSLLLPAKEKNRFSIIRKWEVYACQLHDIVLELIIKLSAEAGFATTLSSDGEQVGAPLLHQRDIIRRLSIHNNSNTNASINENKDLSKVRSLDVFGHPGLMPALSRFRVLRVLQLEDCSDLGKNHLKDLSNLYLLKFLRLHGLKVTELPESIGRLELLETLDMRGCRSEVIILPLSFGKLDKLVRLLAARVELPDGVFLDNMKSLQELEGIRPTLHAMTEIGKLKELKVFKLEIGTKLDWILAFQNRIINRSLACLTALYINVCQMHIQPEDLDKLAELPSLRFLQIFTWGHTFDQRKFIICSSPSAFPCLTDLQICCSLMFIKFQPGAMQKLQRIGLRFRALAGNGFDCGFENLPSLRHVFIKLREYCPKVQDAIRKKIHDHPNHPSLDFYTG